MTELRIHFKGYWQCRQATDPDPSDEPRGVSGYTFAVGYENNLDQVIYLQREQIPDVDFREPHTTDFGVFMTGAEILGDEGVVKVLKPGTGGRAKVFLLPSGGKSKQFPKFELRNEIIFHKRLGIIMPICPFNMEIRGEGWKLRREDPLDLGSPSKEVWQMVEGYERRSPKSFNMLSDEVAQAIGIEPAPDYPTAFRNYFADRKQWLKDRLSEVKDPIEAEGLKTRIWAIDSATQDNERIQSRLGLQAIWEFDIRGKKADITGANRYFGGTIDRKAFWHTRFWMGGFDGDLMRGYMRGYLQMPFALHGKHSSSHWH